MHYFTTPIAGACLITLERIPDLRGSFARIACDREFRLHGLDGAFVQASISQNRKRGTVRGMHLQLPPSRESKLVRVLCGAILDVIVDLRPDSPTFLEHYSAELTAENGNALYMPSMVAHGFQTLEDDTEVLYQMTDYHAPELGFGIRWNDPLLGIRWPITSGLTMISRDAEYPDFDAEDFRCRMRSGVVMRPAERHPGRDWS